MSRLSDEAVERLLSQSRSEVDDVNVDVTLEDIESQGNRESLRRQFQSIADYNKMLKEKIVFINQHLSYAVPFTRENLYLICAYTGSGKSTIAANISEPLWQQNKKVLVISNEETETDVICRISCLHQGLNFNDYKKGMMPDTVKIQMMSLFEDIQRCVKVIDVSYNNGLTTRIEGVINLLEQIKRPESEYSCVMIDYFQRIKYSKYDKTKKEFNILGDLSSYLVRYIKDAPVPVVLFAQLHSIGKRNNPDLDSRIKDYPAIIEAATVVIEAIPDFETKTTDFRIAKDRFGYQGKRIQCGFDKGKFVQIDDNWLAKQRAQKVNEIEEQLGDTIFGANGQIAQIEDKKNGTDTVNEEVPDMQAKE